jgi:hypothetical protein
MWSTYGPFLFELGPERCMRLGERGGDSAIADVARGGDLRVGEVAEVAEEHDQAAARREAADCSLQQRIALGLEQLRLGLVGREREVTPPLLERNAVCDLPDPGGEAPVRTAAFATCECSGEASCTAPRADSRLPVTVARALRNETYRVS